MIIKDAIRGSWFTPAGHRALSHGNRSKYVPWPLQPENSRIFFVPENSSSDESVMAGNGMQNGGICSDSSKETHVRRIGKNHSRENEQ
jgi:hypothetical protein